MDENRKRTIRRRPVLSAFGGLALGSVLAGCGSSGETGTLSTSVSDQPGDIGDFDSLLIQINGIRVKPEDEDLQQLDADAEVDLTELVGEASAIVDESDLETGTYEFLQLEAEATEATLADGGSADVSLPGDAPLKFNKAFEIRSGQTTSFIADFTPVKQGQTNRYVLQPVADEVKVSYETQTEA
ncbi:MAG: DUF4382 domain-containing protein [Halobacteriales archaeon]|nr:DUF4382 domain-containing protein [Halobacteriales archaeon]